MTRTETFEITLTSREIENEIWGLDSIQQVDLILAMAQRYKNDQYHVLMQLTNIADDFKEKLTDEERRYALRLFEDIITYLKGESESVLTEYKMKEKEAVQIALEAFHLDEWIDSIADGGITPPRIILNVGTEHFGCGFNVTIKYKYPPESHPNNDITYHLSEPEKVYSSTYVLTDNRRIYRKDSDKLFSQNNDFSHLVRDNIARFFSKYNIKEVRPGNPNEDNIDKSSLVHGNMNDADSVDSIDVVKLTDTEQRIFLAAMARELKICREENRNPGDVDLVAVCNNIERKVKNALF